MKTENYQDRIEQAKKSLQNAEYILLGGGAGLSDAAGLKYDGARFHENFREFIDRYHFKDLYTSSFFGFETEEEFFAYWAKHISMNRYEMPAAALYQTLLELVQKKDYFVLTTNVDHQFAKAGFDENRIFAVQGDYGYFQCQKACHNTLYENEQIVKEMIKKTDNCMIPTELIPKCPVCNGRMDMNLRKDEFFVEDENWHRSAKRYNKFQKKIKGRRVVYLELGVGFNTPGIIRTPFEQMTYENPEAVLIRINKDYSDGVRENKEKTISFSEDMEQVVHELLNT